MWSPSSSFAIVTDGILQKTHVNTNVSLLPQDSVYNMIENLGLVS